MFVTVDYKSELLVIATGSGAILATVPVPLTVSGEPPLEIAISPNGLSIYVFAPQARPNSLLLEIDATTYQVTRTANIGTLGSVGPLLVSPDGTQLYFEVGYASQYIQVVDAATLSLSTQIPVNEYPSDLDVTPSGLILMTDTNNQLLVVNPQSSDVTVFSLLPNNSQGTPGAIISSPDSTTAYIAYATGSILAVNISTGAIVFDAPIAYSPTNFAISPDGNSLYSTNRSSNGAWSLSDFNIATREPVASLPQLGPISALALTKNGENLCVLNANESAITTVDVASQKVSHVNLGGVGINSLAIPPGGATVWASDYSFGSGGDILFLNPATEQIKYIVGVTGAIAFSPGGTIFYSYSPSRLTAYNLASLTEIGSIGVGQLTNLDQAIPSPDGTKVYISASFVSGSGNELFAPGEILVLDTSTFKYTAAISVPDGMGAMALTPDGGTLVYTANYGRVHLLSTATRKVTATVELTPANGLLGSLALSPDGATAYVGDAVNNLLIVANLTTQSQQASIAVGSTPLPIAITPDGSEAWVGTLSNLEIVNTNTYAVSAVTLPGEPSAIVFAP
jgi:YVTN family beta-propeller protein